ncbi:CCA tRNA nucleotidyltransferase [Georgenia sp. Z1491]|uniref:CCA tRNA nucleotidyltransferase n=1 Tax=Georgenia sp. Z1491 TaxID=3416707 RepID=UPI003CEDF640
MKVLADLPRPVLDLAAAFVDAGEEIALVGGPVRDAFLEVPPKDIDLTTSATPEDTERLLRAWGARTWDMGREFGTIGGARAGLEVEVTTYRTDEYEVGSRKPAVAFGDSLEGDLSRRDFTVNAMAVRLPGLELVDPHDGLGDLARGVLRTPVTAEQSFDDDPLRIMRAARFAAQLGFDVVGDVREAMTAMASRLEIVSAERVRAELERLLVGDHPRAGLRLLVDTGVAEVVLPELALLRETVDEHGRHKDVYEHTLTVLDQAVDLETGPDGPVPGPDLVLRLAAVMHDVGKPATRRFEPGGGVSFHHHELVGAKLTAKRMRALTFDKQTTKDVARLVELHLRFHGYGDGAWTDSAVRRYVTDAGPLLERLHRLTRADSTTRNRRKAARLSAAYDDLERRIEELAEAEELAAIRPDLDGSRIMELLGISPGPLVGRAYQHLLALRMEEGPLGDERAEAELLAWWAEQPESSA